MMRRIAAGMTAIALVTASGALAEAPGTAPLTAAPEAGAQTTPPLDDAEIARIFREVRDMLEEAANERLDAQRGGRSIVERVIGTSPQARADRLLSSAFEVIADAPIVDIQREIATLRDEIAAEEGRIATLREEKISAPEEASTWGQMTGVLDRAAIERQMAEAKRGIASREARILGAKDRFRDAMRAAGTELSPEQADLLLDSVTGDDIVRIAAAYEVARAIGRQLQQIVEESGEELTAARRYYAMHTTLIALLAHSQKLFLDKVDSEYLPRLDGIEREVRATRVETERLLADEPTETQRTVLETNRESQDITRRAVEVYRDYLERQRDEVARAHERTMKDLAVADNTLRTVDASFRLREIMESATMEFETLQTLESPGFETLFQNRELRERFEELSDKLRAPGS